MGAAGTVGATGTTGTTGTVGTTGTEEVVVVVVVVEVGNEEVAAEIADGAVGWFVATITIISVVGRVPETGGIQRLSAINFLLMGAVKL